MWLGKRVFDIFVSLISLILLSPLFLVVSAWIKADSSGPVFYRQKRVGLGEEPFFIHKFRTMSQDADKKGLSITVGKDSRITKSGHFLRKFKIDELPQFIDVLLGKMSIVGPRPEVPQYVECYSVEERQRIFKLRPGITDWASIKFKDENALLAGAKDPNEVYIKEILPIKISYYEQYAKESSFLIDLKIIYLTARAIWL